MNKKIVKYFSLSLAFFLLVFAGISLPVKETLAQGSYTCTTNTIRVDCNLTPNCDTGFSPPPGACSGPAGSCEGTFTCVVSGSGSDIFGEVNAPPGVSSYPSSGGLSVFVGNILKILIVIAGIYTLFNFVFAGYMFLSAGDDPKKIQNAWAKIYQSAIGLAVAASAFVLAGVIGQLIFGSPNALLQIRVFGP